MAHPAATRALNFATEMNMRVPVLMAPMAGACPPELAAGVANAGGMGACGVLLMQPAAITQWVTSYRAATEGPLQLNNWIPDPAPVRDREHERRVSHFLETFGPEVPAEAADRTAPDFEEQCETMLQAAPDAVSSIMGVYDAAFVERLHAAGIKWFATATTVTEAREAEAAGADVIVAQGMEAGGHRGAFNAEDAETSLVGLFALLPAIVDAVSVPVIATGGIADSRGVTAALMLGASGVQIGTGLLRSPEAGINAAWADAIGAAKPEDTVPTRAFSGRLGRSIRSRYVSAANSPQAPEPAPYPVQRALTQAMRDEATAASDIDRMQAWAGQSSGLAQARPASEIVPRPTLFTDATTHLFRPVLPAHETNATQICVEVSQNSYR